jgi:hypothetical protein
LKPCVPQTDREKNFVFAGRTSNPWGRGIRCTSPEFVPGFSESRLVHIFLDLSFESVPHVRDALRKFVNGEMQADDLAAIVRTSAGMGALHQCNVGRVDVSSFMPARNQLLLGGHSGRSALRNRRSARARSDFSKEKAC